MASLTSLLSPPSFLHQQPTTPLAFSPKPSLFQPIKPTHFQNPPDFAFPCLILTPKDSSRLFAVAEEATLAAREPSSEAARRLYVGNIPRTVNNAELAKIVEEHGAVEKAEVMYDKYSGRSRRFAFVTMKTVEDANAAIEKLNGTQIGGREIKVNLTEKPLSTVDMSFLQADESQFIDSAHKVYVGNLAKTVTNDMLQKFFSEKGNVLSAKVSRILGTSKSSGFGFVTFTSEEDVNAAILSFNNALLEGQKIRVNKA